jgi:uncharacterized Fe-S cluster-containing radical SAM superfamily protein
MKYCKHLNEHLYIDNPTGGMCLCQWLEPSKVFIGNVLTDDIIEAYNSEHAKLLRSTMDDQSFRFCRLDACPHLQNKNLPEISEEEYAARKKDVYIPHEFNLAYDFVCNQYCETCRKDIFKPDPNYGEQIKIINDKLVPYLNNATVISACGHGDPFASKYMMEVLENMRPAPECTLFLETNGVYFDEAHWERIKHLAQNHVHLLVTINSFDEFIYNHISRGGDFQRVQKNLKFMSQLRCENKIDFLVNTLVIQDRNFREIPSFIKRSLSDEFAFDQVILRPVYQWGTMDDDVYWFKDVLNPLHPYHQEFLEICNDPSMHQDKVYNFGGDTLHQPRPYPRKGDTNFPFKHIKNNARVVLYGAGQVGQVYKMQLDVTEFCNLVCWLDANPIFDCVEKPEAIACLPADSYDYVVLATANEHFAVAMMNTMLSFGVPKEKIIWGDKPLCDTDCAEEECKPCC